jgi:adenylate cyclase
MPVRSLQLKFSALVVTLLVVACVGLTWLATQHERRALEVATERRGVALVVNLAGDAKEPLLAADQLRLEMLAQQVGSEDGLVAVRLLDRDGRVVASLDPAERGEMLGTVALEGVAGSRGPGTTTERRDSRLLVAVPVQYSDVHLGEAQIELDLAVLVEPEVAESQRQLLLLAVVVVIVGVAGGVIFVALLVGPLRRLRAGVERLARGDLTVRIPPTSADEVGELTRAFNQMGESLQQKERIQSAFGRYVSDYVLSQLLEGGETDELGGIEREVTVLFADIRRFTRLSEGLPASRVVSLLNEIFQLASDRILAAGGTIDKFIGDSVMAYFGAPVPQSDHAQRAVQAAIDLQRAVAERNQRRAGSGAPIVSLGIGIHTGAVVVGTIGSDRRTDFTAVGDAVNVAQRLEKLARPEEILVSEAVQRRVRGTFKLRFEGERQLSGRLEPVHVYSVDQSPPPARAGAPGREES